MGSVLINPFIAASSVSRRYILAPSRRPLDYLLFSQDDPEGPGRSVTYCTSLSSDPGSSSLFSFSVVLCFVLQVGNISRVIEKINGVARCPYDPRHNSTAVITARSELYAATVIDFSGRDPAIYRSLGSIPPLRTAQYNSKWLNGMELRYLVL